MLRLLLQLGGAASMVYIAAEVAIAAVREYQEEGKTARAWRQATTQVTGEDNNEEPAESSDINRDSTRDSGTGIRDLRADSSERRPDSRD